MTKFYKCRVCGNIIIKIHDSGITPFCCNRTMTELLPTSDAGNPDAHLPVVSRIDCSKLKVVIGHVPHPMAEEHHIQFIYLETNTGGQLRYLESGSAPEAVFFTTDTPIAVYAYCNMHGLWKIDIPSEQECDKLPQE